MFVHDPIPPTRLDPPGDTPGDPFAAPDREATPPAASGPARRRRRADLGLLVASSVLSAVLASGTTAALVAHAAANAPATTGATNGATTAIAAVSSTSGATAAGTSTIATTDPTATVAASAARAVVTIETTISASNGRRSASGTGVGSGFIYTSTGQVITAAHVVEGATSITVTLADGRSFDGTVVASDAATDVAIVRIAATGLPTIPLAWAGATIGQTVLAIGDPLGEYAGSVTIGIVSGTDRAITVADELTGQPRTLTGLLQTDAAINQGNSGGPLVDASGSAIGVVSAGSSAAQGIGFAVPISAVRTLLAGAGLGA